MPKVIIVGIVGLQMKLKTNASMDKVKTVVQKNGDQMNEKMKKNTESAFVKGYSHGDTAGSIFTTIKDNGLTAEVGPTTEYSPYVEYGTRFMEPEPFIKPAFDSQKEQFKKDMDKLVR